MQVVNLFGDEWDGRRDRPGWQWKHASVSERARRSCSARASTRSRARAEGLSVRWEQSGSHWMVRAYRGLAWEWRSNRSLGGRKSRTPGDKRRDLPAAAVQVAEAECVLGLHHLVDLRRPLVDDR